MAMHYRSDLASTVTCTGVTYKLGGTNLTAFTNTYANNINTGQGGQTTVLSNGIVTFPTGSAGAWATITFTTPFYYNGVDHLVVEMERTAACSSAAFTEAWLNEGYNGVVYSATPGSLTGLAGPYSQNAKFIFSGGDNTVIAKDSAGDNSNNIAPGTAGRTQMLILASDITGTGAITGMAIQPDTITGGTAIGVTVVMANSSPTITNLVADFATNRINSTSTTTVVSNLTYTHPNGMATPVWIPFNNGTFNYNGSSNILVDIIVTAWSGTTHAVDYENVTPVRLVTSGDPAAATGTVRNRSMQPVFRFNGSTMDTVTAGSSSDSYPFSGSASPKRQYLYPATMLGTQGSISKIAFRLKNASNAGAYGNVEVIMGHTVLSSLTTTFASNMVGPSTVYSGSVTIPAGMKAGDWIEIPLSSAFAYDGVSNLVVQVAADTGGVQNSIVADGASSQYTGYHLFTGGRASATGLMNNFIVDQRLWYSK
ncbi:MAG: hypothetical protein AABZ15_17055 [Nitrospirota bacterium]